MMSAAPRAPVAVACTAPMSALCVTASRLLCNAHCRQVDHILRTLDGMAAGKLNVLHWHYSDSVAFSLRLDTLPALAELVCCCLCVWVGLDGVAR